MSRQQKKVSENHRRSIVSRYNRGEGLVKIHEALGGAYSIPVIRRVLVENDVELRGRGRPCLAEVTA